MTTYGRRPEPYRPRYGLQQQGRTTLTRTPRHAHARHPIPHERGDVWQCCCGTWVTGAQARLSEQEVQAVPIGGWWALARYAAWYASATFRAEWFTEPPYPPPYRGILELRRRQKRVRAAVRAERKEPTATRRRDPRERWWRRW